MKRYFLMTLCGAMLAFMLLGVVSCNNEDSSDNSQTPFRPQNVKATVEDSRIFIQWSASWESSASWTVIGSSSYDLNINTKELHSTYTYVYDSQPYEGYNYYQVINNRTNEKSEIISVYYSSPNNGGGNDNGDNNSGDNGSDSGSDNGGDNGNGSGNGGNEGGSGNDNGGSIVTKPSAPTGVSVSFTGTDSHPEIKISWNEVEGATSYKVYRGSNSNSVTYFYTTDYLRVFDREPLNGYNYYRIKAVNSVGESDYSSSAYYYYEESSNNGGGGSTPTKLDAPTNVEAYGNSYTSFVQISFDPVHGASGYELHRSKYSNSGYKKITASGGPSGNSYVLTDQSPLSGTSYYKVKAIGNSSYNTSDSDYSSYVQVTR